MSDNGDEIFDKDVYNTKYNTTGDLINEAEKYEHQAKENSPSLDSDIPRLLELLEIKKLGSDELTLRRTVQSTFIEIVKYNPKIIGGYYPEIIEKTLITPESRVLARKLLHETVELIGQDVQLKTISGGFRSVESEIRDFVQTRVSNHGSDERLPTNGATTIALSNHIEEQADSVSGQEQLVFECYADALKTLVQYYAVKQGLDPIDAVVDLQARYETKSGSFSLGFSNSGTIKDMIEEDETQLQQYVLRNYYDANSAVYLMIAHEQTVDKILRAEAVLAEQIQ